MFVNNQYVICPKTQAFFQKMDASYPCSTIVKEDSEVFFTRNSIYEIIKASQLYYGKNYLHKEWETKNLITFTSSPELRLFCYPQRTCQKSNHIWLLHSKVQLIEEVTPCLKMISFKDGSNIIVSFDRLGRVIDIPSIFCKNSSLKRVYLYEQSNGIQLVKEEKTIQYTTYYSRSK